MLYAVGGDDKVRTVNNVCNRVFPYEDEFCRIL